MKGKNGRKLKINSFAIIVAILTLFSISMQVVKADNQISVTFLPMIPNQPPKISNEYPTNNSTNVRLEVTCHIDVSDEENDPLDIYWYENSAGTWTLSHTDSSVLSGTHYWTYSQATNYSTTYYWRVIVNDGNNSVWAVYYFTTEPEPPPPPPPLPPVPNKPPIAKITGPDKAYANETVIFYANESYDPDGNITGYRWDFDSDGIFDTDWTNDTLINYSYSTPGNYTIRLRVIDDQGALNMTTHFIQIIELKPPLKLPIPQINGPYNGYTNENIIFNSTGSYDPDGTIIKYTWYFGDNCTSYEENPTHAYAKPGNYTVILIVTDNDNLSNLTTTKAIILERKNEQPEEKVLPFSFPWFLIIAIIISIAILIASILKRRKEDDSDENEEKRTRSEVDDLVIESKVDEVLSKSDKKEGDNKEP